MAAGSLSCDAMWARHSSFQPLGPMLHLKELDRQATLGLRALRTGKQNGFSLTAVKLMIAFLRHLLPHGWYWTYWDGELVEQRGIEPLTSALRTPRSPN